MKVAPHHDVEADGDETLKKIESPYKKDSASADKSEVDPHGPRRLVWHSLGVALFVLVFVTVTAVYLTKDGNDAEPTSAVVLSNPCDVSPCTTGETCQVVETKAVCLDSKVCDPNPCHSGAPICVQTASAYECLSACDASEGVCNEDEVCEDSVDGLSFRCKHLCDEPNPCGPGHLCDVEDGAVVCTNVNPCDPNPCQEGAPICLHENGAFKCTAACGNNPDACKDDIEECVDISGGGMYVCKHKCDDPHPCGDQLCTVGGDGQVACFQRNPCDPNPCREGAPICLSTQGNFKCMGACEATPNSCAGEEICQDENDGMSLACKEPCSDPHPCLEDEICLFNRNTTRFECSLGSPCSPNPCGYNSVCIDIGHGDYACE